MSHDLYLSSLHYKCIVLPGGLLSKFTMPEKPYACDTNVKMYLFTNHALWHNYFEVNILCGRKHENKSLIINNLSHHDLYENKYNIK